MQNSVGAIFQFGDAGVKKTKCGKNHFFSGESMVFFLIIQLQLVRDSQRLTKFIEQLKENHIHM